MTAADHSIAGAGAMPARPARVAMVEPVGGHGGMDFWNHSLCNALAAAGWQPVLLTSQAMHDPADAYDAWNVFHGVFGPDPKWRRGLRHVSATIRGLWRARRLGARIAHFHMFHVGLLQYFGVVLARAFGMRVVLSAHDVGSFRGGEWPWLLRRLYRTSDGIIAYSDQGRRTLAEAFAVPAHKTFVVPLGNFTAFLPPLPPKTPSKASFGYTDDDFVLLFFGQLKKVKRLDVLLRATALARRRGADRLRLLVAGSAADSDMASLQQLIADEGLHGVVQMHVRYVSNEDLPRYFAAADLAVLPYDHIFQSGVVLLTMSNGIPVLTSDIPGMLEVIDHGVSGLTFRAGDPDDLADALIAAAGGRWDLSKLSAAAKGLIDGRYSWQTCARATIAAYRGADEVAHQSFATGGRPSGSGAS